MTGLMFAAAAMAQEQGAGAVAPPGYMRVLAHPMTMMVVIFAVIYLLMIRPQQQRVRQHQEMLRNLQRGDKVVSESGIYGTVVALDEKVATLQVDERVRIRMDRWKIASKVKDEPAA